MSLIEMAQLLGNLGEFVGAIAVVVTLAYLAVQIRQNTAQLKLQTSNEVVGTGQEGFTPIYFPEMNRIWGVGHQQPDQLDDLEFRSFGHLMQRQIANFQNIAYQAAGGALEPELLDSYCRVYGAFIETQGGRIWWRENREDFTPVTRKLLDESDL